MENDDIIQRLRGLNVLVLHPRDGDAEELLQQLNRIGCRAQAIWPPPQVPTERADLVFAEVSEKPSGTVCSFLEKAEHRPTLIGLARYESPSVLQNLIDLKVDGVLAKPIRPYGVLSSLVIARRVWQEAKRSEKVISKLKSKVENSHKMNEAKIVLMRIHGIDEDEAYRAIRQQAMESRKTIAEVAQSIIESNALLHNFVTKPRNEDGASGDPDGV
ncbi:ANTAR domain-containing response regulator [Aquisalimonas asiatica]|uniref:Two-component response regulator, AmiR/NasT family, consists of REC and RNA-binding antiterminator (ANTAR) domains n=1 Tax=Aquisalimonas asiatica TaxID=406100 RepID=A0A1H8V086_9GAMM|nr:ANTAR domain-containing protein [Aquisalimonas asiatica]SEP08791.1 Two-component response regulator, AmiR/NasT family, consists of REC and RNA-binding antiterminator (ANTAR) domains [Aquisalimonas asiatica]